MKLILFIILVLGNVKLVAQTAPEKAKITYRDTIKIIVPRESNFNPTNAKLSNSKIKTPVYENDLTGTGVPGDVNTGLSPNNHADHQPVNPALEKVKEIKDSTYNNTYRPNPLHK